MQHEMEDELEDDEVPAATLAAASVPADLLDDSEDDAGPPDDLPPVNGADDDMNIGDGLIASRTPVNSAGPPAGQLDDDEADIGVRRASGAKQTQLLDDDDDVAMSDDERLPVASSAADAAPSMQPEEAGHGELGSRAARAAELSSIDEATLALEDSLPASVPESLVDYMGGAARDVNCLLYTSPSPRD